MFRGWVQYSNLKLPSECVECHPIEAVENMRMYSRISLFGRRGITAISPGLFPKCFSTHYVSCYCI